jgi:YVTN family beta-propeller protein
MVCLSTKMKASIMRTAPALLIPLVSLTLITAFLPAHCLSQTPAGAEALHLTHTIALPNVKGRLDHMEVDPTGKRLFLASLENGSVEVIDLQTNKWLRSITGFQKPQGIAYVASLNKLFVASGDDAMVRVFHGDTLAPIDSIKLEPGTNRLAYDPQANLLYVGYGGKDAGKDYGEVGLIDCKTDKLIATIRVAAHPAELLLDGSGHTLYAFISVLNQIQVIDTRSRQVTSTWSVSSKQPGDAAFDESTNRLFAGTHIPPEMIAIDSRTGKEIAKLPTGEGMDGVYFDALRKRIYISAGRGAAEGYVFVYQQLDPDHYQTIAKILTRPGAGTSFWSPQLNRYYVAAPSSGDTGAAILVFEPREQR